MFGARNKLFGFKSSFFRDFLEIAAPPLTLLATGLWMWGIFVTYINQLSEYVSTWRRIFERMVDHSLENKWRKYILA